MKIPGKGPFRNTSQKEDFRSQESCCADIETRPELRPAGRRRLAARRLLLPPPAAAWRQHLQQRPGVEPRSAALSCFLLQQARAWGGCDARRRALNARLMSSKTINCSAALRGRAGGLCRFCTTEERDVVPNASPEEMTSLCLSRGACWEKQQRPVCERRVSHGEDIRVSHPA